MKWLWSRKRDLNSVQAASIMGWKRRSHFRRYSVYLPTLSAFRKRNRKRRYGFRPFRTKKQVGDCLPAFLVRKTGLEPVRCEPHAPQTCASASSATSAFVTILVYHKRMSLSSPFLQFSLFCFFSTLYQIFTPNLWAQHGQQTVCAPLIFGNLK